MGLYEDITKKKKKNRLYDDITSQDSPTMVIPERQDITFQQGEPEKLYAQPEEVEKAGQLESIGREFFATGVEGMANIGSALESMGKKRQIEKGKGQWLARRLYGDEYIDKGREEAGKKIEEFGKKMKTLYGDYASGVREKIIDREDQNILSKGAHTVAGGIGSMTSAIGAGAIGGAVAGPAGAVAGSMGVMGMQEKGSAVEDYTKALAETKGVKPEELTDEDTLNIATGSNIYAGVAAVLEHIVPAKVAKKF